MLDCLGGYLRLAEALADDAARYSGEWNFGPADAESRPVADVVEALAAEWGSRATLEARCRIHAPEEQQLRLDVSKAANVLGWRGRLSIDEALRWVASWYGQYHRGEDARTLCRDQIASYLERAERCLRHSLR